MSHARIEEVSDSDPEIDDITEYLPSTSEHALQPMNLPVQTQKQSSQPRSSTNPTLLQQPPPSTSFQPLNPPSQPVSRAALKTHCTLYPLYFDSTRPRSRGRRVHTSLATPNPLAYSLLQALRSILATQPGPQPLNITLEPDKTHPNDWANPGRVRIRLYDEDTHEPLHPSITKKAQLYKLIGKWLHDNPTQPEDPLELKIQGLTVPENFLEGSGKLQRPKGWEGKMGVILPVHSPAVSGGGVSENFFKEAMQEMQAMQGGNGGGGGGGMPGMPGGGGMPDMAALQSMMGNMGGMGGLGGLMGGAGGGGPSGGGGGAIEGAKKGKGKKK